MARPVRINVAGGWYHVTARGIERRLIFSDRRDYEHFLELLGAMAERYGVQVHAYVLMGNHYHLLVRTPEAVKAVVERNRGERWADFSDWHGDWGRDLGLYGIAAG